MVWADTIIAFGMITVMAENLETIREIVLSQPRIDTRTYFFSMLIPTSVHMVNTKKNWITFSTTGTFISISYKNFRTEYCSKLLTVNYRFLPKFFLMGFPISLTLSLGFLFVRVIIFLTVFPVLR